MKKEELRQRLMDYFRIGIDCYAYNLTRVKEGFAVGTVTIDDFVEFDEEIVDDIVDYVLREGSYADIIESEPPGLFVEEK